MKKFEEAKSLCTHLSTDCQKMEYSDVYVAGITSDFDRLFELCWKSMKDYLFDEKGIREAKTGSPKDILKLAYSERLINEPDMWLKILKDRNDDTHHYNMSNALEYLSRIQRDYIRFIQRFLEEFSLLVPEDRSVYTGVPESFLQEVKDSGMYYDEYLNMMKVKYDCSSAEELFIKLDKEHKITKVNSFNA